MGLIDTEAIVLRTYKLAEADKIVICLTRREGLVRGVARGARRLKSKFGASLEPFTLLSLSYFEKEGRELVSIRQAEIVRSYFKLARNVETVAMLEYFAELAIEFAPPHQADERLFRMVKACVEAGAADDSDFSAIVSYYELWMLKLAGLLPELRTCAICRKNLPQGEAAVYMNAEGALRCSQCAGGIGIPLSVEAHRRIRSMHIHGPIEWARTHAQVSAGAQQQISQLSRRLISRALEREPRGQPQLLTSPARELQQEAP